MSDTLTPNSETLTIRQALEAAPRLGAAGVAETIASLLSLTHSRPVVEGLKLVAWIAGIVTEEQPSPVAVPPRDALLRMGAALAAAIRDESARFDWKATPALWEFLRHVGGRHPEAHEALVTGATLNARALRARSPKRHRHPLRPRPLL